MNLQTIEMPAEEAKQAFHEYRRAIRSAKTAVVNSEDAQIARCYRALSEGRQVMNLDDAMRQAGEDENGLPRLAISRADRERLAMERNWLTGRVSMYPAVLRNWVSSHPYRDQVFRWDATFSVREGTITRPNWNRTGQVVVSDFEAIVPNIPPALRPPHDLKNYHLLWEPKWEVRRNRAGAPGDPALLKHLGGPLYAVLATWDLTLVEQAVLGVTRN